MVCMAFRTTIVLLARSEDSFASISAWGTCCVSNSTAFHIAVVYVGLCLDSRTEENSVI